MSVSYSQMQGPSGLLARRAAFRGNSLSAWIVKPDGYPPYSTGILSHEECVKYWDARERARATGQALYVVYSYVTPIAWDVGDEAAYCTPEKFSRTTSRGQGTVRAWINHNVRELVA